MRQSDIHSLGIEQSISPVGKGAGLSAEETLGAGIDLQGCESASVVVALGTIAHADTTGAVTVQESDDNVTFTDVASTDLIGDDVFTGLVIASSGKNRKKGYIGSKRYIRAKLVLTTGASTGSFPVSVNVVKGHNRVNPVASV